MYLLWIFLIVLFPVFSAEAASAPAEVGACDKWFRPVGEARGILLLTHGLNLHPNRMDELADAFVKDGYEVFRPAFTGHCGENKIYLEVKNEAWEADARKFFEIAKARASATQKPIFLVAYSFSALVFQTLANDLTFDRKVFFAPAFSTHFWYPILKFIANWIPDFSYNSFNLPTYRANERSSFRSTLAMDAYLQKWRRGAGKSDLTPILAWIDPEDELVSYQGLVTIAADKGNWLVEKISNKESTLEKTYHHLIIDSAAMGRKEWKRVLATSSSFLRGSSPK